MKSCRGFKRLRRQRGQGMIEYLVLVALMAVGTIGIIRALNHVVQARFANAIYALQGSSQRARTESIDESDYKKKDLSDFMNGAASRSQDK